MSWKLVRTALSLLLFALVANCGALWSTSHEGPQVKTLANGDICTSGSFSVQAAPYARGTLYVAACVGPVGDAGALEFTPDAETLNGATGSTERL